MRVTACHPDTSLGVSATCHEANGGPSIVRSQGWYSNSKKDTSVTLSCDFWNNFWFWMICSKAKISTQDRIQETFSCSHHLEEKVLSWTLKTINENTTSLWSMSPKTKGCVTSAKSTKTTIPFTIYSMTFHLGTFGTGLYSYWCWTWSCDQGSQSANPCCRKWGNRPFNSSGVFQCVTVPRGREIGGWIGGQIDQSVENDVAQQKKMILRDWMR